jgi:hypothetical protein
MAKQRIVEATKGKVESKGKGIFLLKIINEGHGSSGYYSRELLENYGPAVFTKGTLSYANHSTMEELNAGRDINKIVGKLNSDAYVAEDEDGKAALYAEYKVRPEWVDFVEEYKDSIGASIFVSGEFTEGEVDGIKTNIVESLDADDPYKSVDLVAAAGRGGKVERVLEAYRATEQFTNSDKQQALHAAVNEFYDEYVWVTDFTETEAYVDVDGTYYAIPYTVNDAVVTLDTENAVEVRRETQYIPINVSEKEDSMEKELEEKFNALAEQMASLVAALTPKPAAEGEGEVDRAEVVESALDAELGKSARKRVLEAVESGKSVEDAIAAEKALRDEILAEAKAAESHEPGSTGHVHEGAATGDKPKDLASLFPKRSAR